MSPQIPWTLIHKNLQSAGQPIDDDLLLWITKHPANLEIYEEAKRIWNETGSLPQPFSPNKYEAWNSIQTRIKKKSKVVQLAQSIGKAAAILVLGGTLGFFLTRTSTEQLSYTKIIAPAGQKTQVILPDSSKVWLNGGSSITYSNLFNKETRDVYLTGEGFFTVSKNAQKQFSVHVSNIEVKVFGTVFNVKKYSNDKETEVGLESGSVAISQNNKNIALLSPGQIAYYNNQNKSIRLAQTDMSVVSAWTKNEIVFDNTPFPEIVKYMERWYGVRIYIAPSLAHNHSYTFKLKTETLREMLELINIMTPIRYEIDGATVRITSKDTK